MRKKSNPYLVLSPLGDFAEGIYYGDKWKPLPGIEYNQMIKSRNKDFMSFSINSRVAGDFATSVSHDDKLQLKFVYPEIDIKNMFSRKILQIFIQ